MKAQNAALLLLGHGSTLNADSSAPTYQHAEELRRRDLFSDIHVAFWKEEANFRQALRQTSDRQIYVVPNFISSGYFTEQIIPRELGLDGPVTHRGDQAIFYCRPVGLHCSMTEALLQRAREIVAASPETIPAPGASGLPFICGHGTSFNDNSTQIIYDQATAIRARGLFADCQAVLMEQKPFVKDWRTLTDCPDVIVVPFFISDGLHSFEDIPVLLGLTHNIREKGFSNPHHEGGRRLWYATAIGTEAFVADVIVAQVSQFQLDHPEATADSASSQPLPSLADALSRFFQTAPAPWRIGEIAIRLDESGTYELIHKEDAGLNKDALTELKTLKDLRELIRLDREEKFRPLRAAPNLRRGWILQAPELAGVMSALDYLYPAAVANWSLSNGGRLEATAWEETAARQTGRFRIVREIDGEAARDLVATHCESGCLKQRLWPPVRQSIQAGLSEIPLLCPEACNFLVGKAREKLKGGDEE